MRPLCPTAAVLGILTAALPPAPAWAQAEPPPVSWPSPEIHTASLANGLTVITVPAQGSPVATAVMVFKGGATTQQMESEEGLPHLLEHMLFRSYGGSSGRSFGSFAGELGASYNGTTGQEAVTYYLVLPSERSDEGIDLLSDLVTSPRFRGADLETEREVVKGELERNVSDPDFLLDVNVDQTLWGDGYRRRNIGGFIPAITLSTVELLNDYYRRNYTPDRAALVVTGDVDPDVVLERARTQLGGWDRAREAWDGQPAPAVLTRDTVLVLTAQTSDVTLMVRWEGPRSVEDREAALAAEVFATMVNQPGSGTQQRLVESGPFVSLSLGYAPDTRGGPMTFVGRTTPDQLLAAARGLRQEMDILARPWGLSEAELAAAKLRHLLDETVLAESPQSLAHTLARRWARGELEGQATVADVTLDHIRDVASRFLAGKPHVCGMLIPDDYMDTRLAQLVQATQLWRGS